MNAQKYNCRYTSNLYVCNGSWSQQKLRSFSNINISNLKAFDQRTIICTEVGRPILIYCYIQHLCEVEIIDIY